MQRLLMTMIVTAALSAAVPAAAPAQVEFGVKGGVSFGNVSNRGLLPGDLDTRTGFAAGLTLGLGGGTVGVGADALYAQRGLTGAAGERELDYLDLPVYLKVQLPLVGVSPFAYAGPQVSFELRCRDRDEDCVDLGTIERAETDYAAVVGAGVRLGGDRELGLTAEARYIYGLRDLELDTVTDEESYKTRSFLILAGILF